MARQPRVRLLNRQRRLKVDADDIRAVVARVLDLEDADPRVVVEVVFLRDSAIAELNVRYRGRGGATDVLSFPVEASGWPAEEPPLLGAVVISTDRAAEQAVERDLPVGLELRRLVVHGVLHLLGYGDETPRERVRMRRRESRYVKDPD